MQTMVSPRMEQSGRDVLLWIKAVPGASRDQISGVLGDRLKVRISVPPEGGRANAAICELIADALNIKSRQVTIESGASSAEKAIRIQQVNVETVRAKLIA